MTTRKQDEPKDEGKKRDEEKVERNEQTQRGIPKEAEVHDTPHSINEPPGSDVLPPEVVEEGARQEEERRRQAEQPKEEVERDKKHK